jgi:hypothetical protein
MITAVLPRGRFRNVPPAVGSPQSRDLSATRPIVGGIPDRIALCTGTHETVNAALNQHIEGKTMKTKNLVANQKLIMKNQAAILANQKKILANQRKLTRILGNQKLIAGNQDKLDLILANQKRLLAQTAK